ncbi:hypothetical protein N9112_00425 [bacterium]|nr:hypothetical protein [bacterium]
MSLTINNHSAEFFLKALDALEAETTEKGIRMLAGDDPVPLVSFHELLKRRSDELAGMASVLDSCEAYRTLIKEQYEVA